MAKRPSQEWFERARKDIEEAEFLFEHNRALENVSFFIQQSIEKYFKGYLVSNRRQVRKVHDLISLLGEVITFDKEFERFSEDLQIITKFYIDSRYPSGFPFEYSREEVGQSLNKAKEIIALVQKKASQEC